MQGLRGQQRCRGIGGIGVYGVYGALGQQVDWEHDHIGPQSRVPSLTLVSLGE